MTSIVAQKNGRENHVRDRSHESSPKDPDSDKDKVQKLVYYPRNSSTVVELFASSLTCLSPTTYLNDEVIQFYTSYLLADCCDSPKRMHVFDNLFHVRLREMFIDETKEKNKDKEKDKNNDKERSKGVNDDSDKRKGPWTTALWNQLKNWYNHINIFEKDFLIFPICLEKHWFAIIVCYPNEVRDCEGKTSSPVSDSSLHHKPVPGIMILDSVGSARPEFSREVRHFLDFEWRTRCTVIKDFFYHELRTYTPTLPKQTNTYDCGIFMLAYIRAFIQQPEKFYRLVRRSSNKEAEADLFEMINNSLTHCGREAIKNLIHRQCSAKR